MARFHPIMKYHLNQCRKRNSKSQQLPRPSCAEWADWFVEQQNHICYSGWHQAGKVFSIILDCTLYISDTEQLSVVIRVVSLIENPISGNMLWDFWRQRSPQASTWHPWTWRDLRSWELLFKTAEDNHMTTGQTWKAKTREFKPGS